MSDRGERLHHEERKKAKFRKVIQSMHYTYPNNGKYQPTAKEVGRMTHTPQSCSCDGCCNPRRVEWGKSKDKLTMQERRHIRDIETE